MASSRNATRDYNIGAHKCERSLAEKQIFKAIKKLFKVAGLEVQLKFS